MHGNRHVRFHDSQKVDRLLHFRPRCHDGEREHVSADQLGMRHERVSRVGKGLLPWGLDNERHVSHGRDRGVDRRVRTTGCPYGHVRISDGCSPTGCKSGKPLPEAGGFIDLTQERCRLRLKQDGRLGIILEEFFEVGRVRVIGVLMAYRNRVETFEPRHEGVTQVSGVEENPVGVGPALPRVGEEQS